MPQPLRILITGASSGIGRALADHYGSAGHTVGAAARRGELLADLARQHPSVEPLQVDVSDAAGMDRTIRNFAQARGGLDLVFVNAGIGQRSEAEGWDPGRTRQIIDVNIIGATNTIVPAVEVMLAHGGGRIVGISSLAGRTPLPHAAAYGASKAWLAFYLDSLDMDLGARGVHCSIVMPGYVATPMVDGADAALVSPGARRAAAMIAERVARGDRIIRFPRRVAMLTSLAMLAPRSMRINSQLKRLAKRKHQRGRSQ
ncbi:MAG: SDR family NAD(P)-dependent oxidoreductase [Phycisphaerales bacterium]|nr:SDR family NAD(P)-dependent oxidoreductase [Phycisphaerales bacterium]